MNFRAVNALLNRQERKQALVYINIPAPALCDNTVTTINIEFKFHVTDYFSNSYFQTIAIKSGLKEVKTETHNKTRIHAILDYNATKPSSTAETK